VVAKTIDVAKTQKSPARWSPDWAPQPAGDEADLAVRRRRAADALEVAASQVVAALGDDTMPRHVALSALLLAGAEQADVVVERLAKQRAAELTERLAALQRSQGSTT
jgi:hypothetical protein